jgi:hypothetical protein
MKKFKFNTSGEEIIGLVSRYPDVMLKKKYLECKKM